MIWEAIQHLLIPAPKHIKAMGYLKESIAIEARFERCARFWAPHLEECKRQILTATEKLKPGASVMILGSGGLHDVPMEELLKRGFKITCVDIVHLPKVKKKYPQVDFVTRDISGMIKPIYDSVYHGPRIMPEPEWEFIKTPDLIISLNLLSQMAMKLLGFAELHGKELGILFSDNIMKAHVEWLQKQKTNILLISDIEREYYQNELLLEKVPSLPKLTLDKPKKTWQWDIAPIGEADPEISIRHVVGAWEF